MNEKHAPNLAEEIEPVIGSGICIGCGACAFSSDGAIEMRRNLDGACEAAVLDREKALSVPGGICPFSDHAPNEDSHGLRLFGDAPIHHDALGYARATWAGFCVESDYRANGSSGGITTWFAAEALRAGLVDAVIHVHPQRDNVLFEYGISRTTEDVQSGAKTRYYSVSFASALQEVRNSGKRFALIGVPCFIKAARNLALFDERINELMVLTIALICGHMKSPGFAESLAWQVGVSPDRIGNVNFRVKLDEKPAHQYGFSATDKLSGVTKTKPMSSLSGRRWDGGYHRLKACDYCDDVLGETADVTFGDAWLQEFSRDPLGTNVIVARSDLAVKLLQSGGERGALRLVPLTASTTASSQAGGLRDRREGLAYRLFLKDKGNQWRPVKRVKANAEGITLIRKLNYQLRQIVRIRSAANFRICKKLGVIWPYRVEMTFWHVSFRLMQIVEKRLTRHTGN